MQRGHRNLVFFVSSALLVGAGLFAAACSSDSDGGSAKPLPTPPGTGRSTSPTDPAPSTTPSTPSTGSDAGDAGTDPDCSTAPYFHKKTENSFFCAHAGDGGKGIPCANGGTCCNPNADNKGNFNSPSFCLAPGADQGATACAAQAATNQSSWADGGQAWQCEDSSNCAADEVCCIVSTPDAKKGSYANIGKDTKGAPVACNALKVYKPGGSKCAKSCAAETEVPTCNPENKNSCPTGTTCKPASAAGRTLGVCQ